MMHTLDGVAHLAGLSTTVIERWVELAWVRPDGSPGHYLFQDIDVARLRLIIELRDDMHVHDDTLPIVLSLLDQLYDTRRQLRLLHRAVSDTAPEPVRLRLLGLLGE